MPSDHCLCRAEGSNLRVLLASWILEQVLRLIVAQVQDDCASEHGEKRILLELVGHDRHVAHSRSANAHALLRVADRVVNRLFTSGYRHGRNAQSAAKQSICNFKEASGGFRDVADEFSFFGDIVEGVQHRRSWNLDLVKHEARVIYTIQANLHAHIFDHNSLAGPHLFVSDAHNEAVHSLVLSVDDGLGEDNCIVGVAGTVRDPEFLGQSCWRVNHKFLSLLVVNRCGLHLRCIVAITKLSETEAAHVLQVRDFLHKGKMPFCVQRHERAAEEIELHRELRGQVSIHEAEHLVGGKNVLWVILEVKNRDQVCLADLLNLSVSSVSLLGERHVKLVVEYGIV